VVLDLPLVRDGGHNLVAVSQVLEGSASLGIEFERLGEPSLERAKAGQFAIGAHLALHGLLGFDQRDGFFDRRRTPDKGRAPGCPSLASPIFVPAAEVHEHAEAARCLLGTTHREQHERTAGLSEPRTRLVPHASKDRSQAFQFRMSCGQLRGARGRMDEDQDQPGDRPGPLVADAVSIGDRVGQDALRTWPVAGFIDPISQPGEQAAAAGFVWQQLNGATEEVDRSRDVCARIGPLPGIGQEGTRSLR
jgi:hypothetical protein